MAAAASEQQEYVEVLPREDAWSFGTKAPLFDYDRETMWDAFIGNVTSFPDAEMMGTRPRAPDGTLGDFAWTTFGEVGAEVTAVGSALVALGLSRGSTVGIFAPNVPRWIVAQYGCYRQSIVPVPLYATLGEAAIACILSQANPQIVFCAARSVEPLLQVVNSMPERPSLNRIVCIEDGPAPTIASAVIPDGVKLMSWGELCSLGKLSHVEADPPKPDDLYAIVYTSGSSGLPKGAMVTHRNVCHAVDTTTAASQFREPVAGWRYISYLPLAHCMELELTSIMIKGRGTIGFFSGSIATLFDDIRVLRPHFIPSVPRVWKKFYDVVQERLSRGSWIQRTMFDWAFNAKRTAMRTGVPTWIDWDKLVLHNVSDIIGGRVQVCMCGAAPMEESLIEWIEVVLGFRVCQVYGLTETFAGITTQSPPYEKYTTQSIGNPFSRCKARIVSVPEMGYSIHDDMPRGELLVWGPEVFSGYYKDQAKTDEVLSKDGWLSTGDCARLNKDGTISIIDRKKNLFKLAQGEYVAVEVLEMVYGYVPCVGQVWVWGNSADSFVVAVVVPDLDKLREIGVKFGHAPDAAAEALCADERIVEEVHSQLVKVGRDHKLKGYEIVKGILLEPVPWVSGDAFDLLTPTLKFKRANMSKKYQAKLEALCQKLRATADTPRSPAPAASPSIFSRLW